MELTLNEVAQRLNITAETARRWVVQGKIPMHLRQGRYVMRQDVLRRWADEHKLKIYEPHPQNGSAIREAEFDGLSAAMRRGGVFYQLDGDTKIRILKSIATRIPNVGPPHHELIFEKLLERERLASTGIGYGIALPHPRTSLDLGSISAQISTFFLSRPIDFDAIDHRPVSVLMVLLSDSTQLHLTMMSKLSFHLRDGTFRAYLLSRPPAPALIETVAALETSEAG